MFPAALSTPFSSPPWVLVSVLDLSSPPPLQHTRPMYFDTHSLQSWGHISRPRNTKIISSLKTSQTNPSPLTPLLSSKHLSSSRGHPGCCLSSSSGCELLRGLRGCLGCCMKKMKQCTNKQGERGRLPELHMECRKTDTCSVDRCDCRHTDTKRGTPMSRTCPQRYLISIY